MFPADLLNLNGVTVSQDVFELLNSNGFNFTNSKIQLLPIKWN